jgi:hypothetical protein
LEPVSPFESSPPAAIVEDPVVAQLKGIRSLAAWLVFFAFVQFLVLALWIFGAITVQFEQTL